MSEKSKPAQQTKICCTCKKEKSVSDFYPDKSKASGYRSNCRDCQLEKDRIMRATNSGKAPGCVVLNFNKIPGGAEMLDKIRKEADKNFRDVDKQVLFIMKEAGGF